MSACDYYSPLPVDGDQILDSPPPYVDASSSDYAACSSVVSSFSEEPSPNELMLSRIITQPIHSMVDVRIDKRTQSYKFDICILHDPSNIRYKLLTGTIKELPVSLPSEIREHRYRVRTGYTLALWYQDMTTEDDDIRTVELLLAECRRLDLDLSGSPFVNVTMHMSHGELLGLIL